MSLEARNITVRLGRRAVLSNIAFSAQARALTAMGCDNLQGFHFGAPMSDIRLREVMRWSRDAEADVDESTATSRSSARIVART